MGIALVQSSTGLQINKNKIKQKRERERKAEPNFVILHTLNFFKLKDQIYSTVSYALKGRNIFGHGDQGYPKPSTSFKLLKFLSYHALQTLLDNVCVTGLTYRSISLKQSPPCATQADYYCTDKCNCY
jgi:hypothetical protein